MNSLNSIKSNEIKVKKFQQVSKNGHPVQSGYHKILPEYEPLIFEGFVKGWTLEEIAKQLKDEFNIEISRVGIWHWKNRNKEEYETFRKEWLADIKAIPLANQKLRIIELERSYKKLSKAIGEVIKEVPKVQWDRINLAGLIRESNKILEQLQDESGDKVHKIQGSGNGSFIFGDQTINVFADKVLDERQKETADLRNRLKADRFSDSGSIISPN